MAVEFVIYGVIKQDIYNSLCKKRWPVLSTVQISVLEMEYLNIKLLWVM